MINKFPVISANTGIEYRIEIECAKDGWFYGKNDYSIRILKETRTKLFGLKRLKELQHSILSVVKYDFDFVKMAMEVLREYEDSAEREKKRRSALADGFAKFNDWDGVVYAHENTVTERHESLHEG